MKKLLCIVMMVFIFEAEGFSANTRGQKDRAHFNAGTSFRFEVKVGAGIMTGDTTYQIGGRADYSDGTSDSLHFPISELEFPLDVFMASVNATAEIRNKWILSLEARKNITDDAGKMEDSDWGTYYLDGCWSCSAGSLDIYSESDAQLDAFIMDINVRYRFYRGPRWSFFAGLGNRYEKYTFDVSNLEQWYPSSQAYLGYETSPLIVDGLVLKYDITYIIPYAEVGASIRPGSRFIMDARWGFSPYVRVEDKDNHILRDKVSDGDLTGFSGLLSLEGRYHYTKHLFSTLSISYRHVFAEGTQKQFFRGEPYAEIDQEIESHQGLLFLMAGYLF